MKTKNEFYWRLFFGIAFFVISVVYFALLFGFGFEPILYWVDPLIMVLAFGGGNVFIGTCIFNRNTGEYYRSSDIKNREFIRIVTVKEPDTNPKNLFRLAICEVGTKKYLFLFHNDDFSSDSEIGNHRYVKVNEKLHKFNP
jgi:hypothetical protein